MTKSTRTFTFAGLLAWLLLILLLFSMSLLVVVSSFFTRRNVRELSDNIVQQAAARVEMRIEGLLNQAVTQNAEEQLLIHGGQWPTDDPEVLGGFFANSLAALPDLTSLGFGWETNGDYVFAERQTNDTIRVREYAVDKFGKRVIHDMRWHGAICESLNVMPWDNYDPRQRPFYQLAVARHTNVWTETYQFWSGNERGAFPGVTYATPLYDTNGALQGVLNADFELRALCRFLADLKPGMDAYAFVVERRKDKTLRLIAHPDASMLPNVADGTETISDLKDHTVAAFAEIALKDKSQQAELRAGHSILFSADGRNFFGSIRVLDKSSLPTWTVVVVVSVDKVMADIYRNDLRAAGAALACLGLAVLVAFRLARRVAEPLQMLTREAEAIGRLELAVKPEPRSRVKEIDQLSRSIANTRTNLRSFQKFVPTGIVRELVTNATEACLGGQRATLTVFFSDIANFTSFSEKMSPEALVAHIGEYLGAMTATIQRGSGTVDKFIGDGIMAFWGAPHADPDHARNACLAALACQRQLAQLRTQWQLKGVPELRARIGLHTGSVIVGNIGSEDRLNYTAIGDSVNLTSRLEGLNKFYGTEILVSASCLEAAGASIIARPVDKVSVKGRNEGLIVCELLGLAGEMDESMQRIAALTSEAFAAYLCRDFKLGQEKYLALLALRPDDKVAFIMEKRCAELISTSPPDDWDTVFRMREK